MGMDRISSLPDDLLCRILVFVPTKHVVATTVLSTRWRNLFASVRDLDLDDTLTQSQTTDVTPFCSFVSKVLCAVITKSGHIRTFRVNCERGTYDFSVISSWVCLASMSKLEDLMVCAKSVTNPVALPLQLFHCTTLKKLRLRGKFPFFVPGYVFFPSLKTLELSGLTLTDDESVSRFLQGCIVLEYLYISDCEIDSISVLEVSVATLKDLHLLYMNGDYEVLLEAPSLESLDCSSYATRGYTGNILRSLVTADIDIVLQYAHFDDEKVSQLINMVQNARSLILSEDTLEPLIHQKITFQNLTKLWVSANTAGAWLSLPKVLDSAPYLEDLHYDNILEGESGNFIDAASCLPERVPACVSTRLKKVELIIFQGEEDEFRVVDYFLRNAKMLENMNVVMFAISDDTSTALKHNFAMTKRLLKLPRCSRACQIEITLV